MSLGEALEEKAELDKRELNRGNAGADENTEPKPGL
jgi:hypothetical protein